MTLKTWPLVTSPTGTLIALAGVAHERAADQAVGRLERDGADERVAEVLGDLERHVVTPSASPSPCVDRSMSTWSAL